VCILETIGSANKNHIWASLDDPNAFNSVLVHLYLPNRISTSFLRCSQCSLKQSCCLRSRWLADFSLSLSVEAQLVSACNSLSKFVRVFQSPLQLIIYFTISILSGSCIILFLDSKCSFRWILRFRLFFVLSRFWDESVSNHIHWMK
jgi:hypothetical protein